jgi:uncharacterized membrane protein
MNAFHYLSYLFMRARWFKNMLNFVFNNLHKYTRYFIYTMHSNFFYPFMWIFFIFYLKILFSQTSMYLVSHCRKIWLNQREATQFRSTSIQQKLISMYFFFTLSCTFGKINFKWCLNATQCVVCFQQLVV